jgi:hypothetical protein
LDELSLARAGLLASISIRAALASAVNPWACFMVILVVRWLVAVRELTSEINPRASTITSCAAALNIH